MPIVPEWRQCTLALETETAVRNISKCRPCWHRARWSAMLSRPAWRQGDICDDDAGDETDLSPLHHERAPERNASSRWPSPHRRLSTLRVAAQGLLLRLPRSYWRKVVFVLCPTRNSARRFVVRLDHASSPSEGLRLGCCTCRYAEGIRRREGLVWRVRTRRARRKKAVLWDHHWRLAESRHHE